MRQPRLDRHAFSPRRRRGAEISAEKTQERVATRFDGAQSALLVGRTPWSAADALVGLLGLKRAGFPGEKRVQGDPRVPGGPPHHFSALPLRSLRLCVEYAFSEWR